MVFMAKMMTSLARVMGLLVAQPAATVTTVLYYSDLLPRSVDFDRFVRHELFVESENFFLHFLVNFLKCFW
ncbi:hypothetical protein ACP275_09G113800 [Erythranthe tilingii]